MHTNRHDPTGTARIQREYARGLTARYRVVSAAIVRAAEHEPMNGFTALAGIPQPPPPPQFPTDPSRVSAFLRWVRRTLDVVVLGSDALSATGRWTDDYVRQAYFRGLTHADSALTRAGYQLTAGEIADIFNLPVHKQTAAGFYSRQYELLRGLNAKTAGDVSRILSDGFIRGRSSTAIAREIADSIGTITLNRANTIARTELVYAMNEASLRRYEDIMGAEGELEILAEFQTAGDRRVCDECQTLEGEVFTVRTAHAIIPVHPNCRCVWVPLVESSAQNARFPLTIPS